MITFLQLAREGKVLPEAIDSYIDEWHSGKSTVPLHEFLGMSAGDYNRWVEDPSTFSFNPIHPGILLEIELQNRDLKPSAFALSIGTYPNAVTEVVKGNRPISPSLAIKLEEKLDRPASFWLYQQADYELAQERLKLTVKESL